MRCASTFWGVANGTAECIRDEAWSSHVEHWQRYQGSSAFVGLPPPHRPAFCSLSRLLLLAPSRHPAFNHISLIPSYSGSCIEWYERSRSTCARDRKVTTKKAQT